MVAQPDRQRLGRFAARLAQSGYEVRESPHFAVGRRDAVVLAHAFGAATIDEDLAPLIAEELGPLGVVTSAREYGEALFAIVASTCPSERNREITPTSWFSLSPGVVAYPLPTARIFPPGRGLSRLTA